MIDLSKGIKRIEDNIYNNILSKVMDPELEIDIVNLGLVYKVTYDGDKTVDVLMTLSTPTCPLGDTIVNNVKESVKNEYPLFEIAVELTYEPEWNLEMISDEGKKILGM